jgi:hypothetical protein
MADLVKSAAASPHFPLTKSALNKVKLQPPEDHVKERDWQGFRLVLAAADVSDTARRQLQRSGEVIERSFESPLRVLQMDRGPVIQAFLDPEAGPHLSHAIVALGPIPESFRTILAREIWPRLSRLPVGERLRAATEGETG